MIYYWCGCESCGRL